MSILSILAKLTMDKTGFDAAMMAAGKAVDRFGAHVASTLKSQLASAFAVTAVAAFAREVVEYGDSIKELGERLGVTAQEAQQFAIASKLGGADMEFFATKFDKLKKAMSDTIAGGDNPFAAFGLSVEKLSKLKPSEVWIELARQIREVGISADQSVKFVETFGKGASKLINIAGDMENAKVGTLFFSDKTLTEANQYSDLFVKLGNNAKVAAGRILEFANTGKWWERLFQGVQQPVVKPTIDESQILTNLEAAEEARKTHMAIQDRILARDKEIAKALADIADDGMTNDEKRNKLLKERQVIMERMAALEGAGPKPEGFEEERQKMILDLLKNQIEVTKIIELIDGKKSNVNSFQSERTNLGSIGGTLGNSGVATTRGLAAITAQVKRTNEILKGGQMVVGHWR